MSKWEYSLNLGDVFHGDDLAFAQRRDEIVRRIRAARFYREYRDKWALDDLTEDIATAEDADAFNALWADFYEFADYERVWVITWPEPAGVASK